MSSPTDRTLRLVAPVSSDPSHTAAERPRRGDRVRSEPPERSPAPSPAPSDEALLMACGSGDTTALGALFDRHHEAVYRLISRLLRSEPSEIDDLVQTTFLEALRSARRYAQRGSVKSFLYGIAANTVRHHVRGSQRRQAAYAAWQPAVVDDTPDVTTLRAQQLAQLAVALAALPYDLRVAYVLCELEDVPGPEAARMLDIRPGTLGRRLHDARRALRAAIGDGP